MVLRDSTEASVIMASETLLTLVAIRLAALVAVGLVAKAVASDKPEPEVACPLPTAAVSVQIAPQARTEAENIMRDMLLHD
jgi:hypothetical protein